MKIFKNELSNLKKIIGLSFLVLLMLGSVVTLTGCEACIGCERGHHYYR